MSRSNYRLIKTLLLIFLGIWLVFTLFPIYFMIITSLKPVEEINRMIPTFWPHTLKLNNYAGIFADPGSLKSLADSVIVSVAKTALSLLLGTLAGYALARWIRGAVGENLAFWILSNRMFPPVAVIIPMFFLFDSMPWGTDSENVMLFPDTLPDTVPVAFVPVPLSVSVNVPENDVAD